MKIGLIVEGDSDKAFFDNYFMKNFSFDKRNLLVLTSGKKKGQCKIENKQIRLLGVAHGCLIQNFGLRER